MPILLATFRFLKAQWLSAALIGIVTAMVLGFTSGCGSSQPSGSPKTFDQLYENVAQYQESTVEFDGQYLGWSSKDCQFPSYASKQITRGDWAFKVGEQCLYVTGGKPEQVDPMDDSFQGQMIHLEATVHLTPDKKMYLEYVRSTFIK